MGEWVAIEHWPDCVRMERPGIVFEMRNADGQSLVTSCVIPLPEAPFDWRSPALEFRPIPAEPPRHSAPIPTPEPRR